MDADVVVIGAGAAGLTAARTLAHRSLSFRATSHRRRRNGRPERRIRTIRTRAAVVTPPVAVLRHAGDQTAVIFDPDPPAAKRDALRSIEMGHADLSPVGSVLSGP